jgi:SAM-dependent methyltransferase
MPPSLLAHPLTRDLAVDDPRTTQLRRQIIATKPFLRRLYEEWYGEILLALGERRRVLELGSGAGFFQERLPSAITSEVFFLDGVDLVADGCALPFPDASLEAIVMTDVFHHIPDVARFLAEAARVVGPQGRIIMIEPWRTGWSQWIYTNFHPEPFLPDSGWPLPAAGPLSGANGALPWIVFERDRHLLAEQFPEWQVIGLRPLMPMAYLLSGGVSLRSLAPGWLYGLTRQLERWSGERHWSMFAKIELARTNVAWTRRP